MGTLEVLLCSTGQWNCKYKTYPDSPFLSIPVLEKSSKQEQKILHSFKAFPEGLPALNNYTALKQLSATAVRTAPSPDFIGNPAIAAACLGAWPSESWPWERLWALLAKWVEVSGSLLAKVWKCRMEGILVAGGEVCVCCCVLDTVLDGECHKNPLSPVLYLVHCWSSCRSCFPSVLPYGCWKSSSTEFL